MKEITLFTLKNCPHCLLAKRLLAELQKEPRYAEITVREIEERENRAIADSYDYWLVPSFFIGREKLHEGHAEYSDVKRVLDRALTDKAQ